MRRPQNRRKLQGHGGDNDGPGGPAAASAVAAAAVAAPAAAAAAAATALAAAVAAAVAAAAAAAVAWRPGYREAVLSGVHLGSYGHDRDDRELARKVHDSRRDHHSAAAAAAAAALAAAAPGGGGGGARYPWRQPHVHGFRRQAAAMKLFGAWRDAPTAGFPSAPW